MPFPRRRDALRFTEAERRRLVSISKSRSDEKRRTLRAAILLDSLSGQSDETIARQHHVSRGTVVLCIRKCLEFGLEAALGELPRPGKPRQLPDDAIAWVLHCACQKPKELGYSYELWTYKLLITHVHQQLRHSRASGTTEAEPVQTAQDPAQGRTAAAQDSVLRGVPGSRLRAQNGTRAACLQGGRNR